MFYVFFFLLLLDQGQCNLNASLNVYMLIEQLPENKQLKCHLSGHLWLYKRFCFFFFFSKVSFASRTLLFNSEM